MLDKTKSRATCGVFTVLTTNAWLVVAHGVADLTGELNANRTGDSLYDVTEGFAYVSKHPHRSPL
jgi:hypothetical protein